MVIKVELVGDYAVEAKLGQMPGKLHAAILRAMVKLGLDLTQIVVTEKLSGQVLKRRTGNLARSIHPDTTDDGATITTAVGFNRNTAPYGVFHEFGVPHSWLIEAKNKKALRFRMGGEWVFRKRVTHPPLPERSFLRSSLADIAPRIGPALEAAIIEGSA